MAIGEGIDGLRVQVQEHERRLGEGDKEHGEFRRHYETLGRDVVDSERRLTTRQDEAFREVRGMVEAGLREVRSDTAAGFQRVEEHLTLQDQKLDRRTSRWPPAAYIVGSAAATLAVGILLAALTHTFGL